MMSTDGNTSEGESDGLVVVPDEKLTSAKTTTAAESGVDDGKESTIPSLIPIINRSIVTINHDTPATPDAVVDDGATATATAVAATAAVIDSEDFTACSSIKHDAPATADVALEKCTRTTDTRADNHVDELSSTSISDSICNATPPPPPIATETSATNNKIYCTHNNVINNAAEETEATDQKKSPPEQILPDEAATSATHATDRDDVGISSSNQTRSMEINKQHEALESMRRLNLEVEFSNASNCFPFRHDRCSFCQREALLKFLTAPPPSPSPDAANGIRIARGLHGEPLGLTIGKAKFDGHRIRRFRGQVGNFFAKSTSNASNTDDGTTKKTRMMSSSRAMPLKAPKDRTGRSDSKGPDSKTMSTMESFGEGSSSIVSCTSENGTSSDAGRRNILKKKIHPCLTCGHPTCAKHSSSTFTKSHIPICKQCANLFEMGYLVEVIASTASNPTECRRKVDEMVDCYDRAKFLLTYAAQYADELADTLDTHTVQTNKIGVGSSATGIVSGVAGVVGCGALLIPPVAVVGVPLLMASLVFGGGANAVQSGDAAVKYFSEPNKLAEKMVALHGMVLSLLRITEVLSYALLKSQCGVNYSVDGTGEAGEREEKDEATKRREALGKDINELLTKNGVSTAAAAVGGLQSAVTSGVVATELAAAGAIAGTEAAMSASSMASGATAVGRGSRYIGRVGTSAASGARFIPIAGGLLSAACIVVEGRELKRTLSKMKGGNACAKAEQVRSIRDEVGMLPDSGVITAEVDRVFELARREKEKQAALIKHDCVANQGLKTVGEGVAIEDVSQGDISDLIDVMETGVRASELNDAAAKSQTS